MEKQIKNDVHIQIDPIRTDDAVRTLVSFKVGRKEGIFLKKYLVFTKQTDVTKMKNGDRGTSTGNGKMKNRKKKQRIGNEVTYRAHVLVRFCSHFSFACFP